jgi:hypothetical protein
MSYMTTRMIFIAMWALLLMITTLAGESLADTSLTKCIAPLAYVGPGAGLGAVGALLAVLGVVVLCVAGLVLYPLQLLRNRLRRRHEGPVGGQSEAKPSA